MKIAGALQIALAMAIWSSWGLFIRWLTVPPWAVTYYVGIISAALAAAVWCLQGNPVGGLWPRGQRAAMVSLGLVFLVNSVTFLTALELTTVANAVLTHYTAPIFVAVLAPLVLGERRLPWMPAALVLSCVGLGLLTPEARLAAESRHLQGLALGTVSGAAYGCLILMARHLSLRSGALPLIFVQNLVIALALLPLGVGLAVPSPRDLGLLLILGVIHATVGAMLYLGGIRKVRAQPAAILGYVEPVGAMLLAALWLNERPGAPGLFGGVLILLAGWLVVWDENRLNNRVDSRAGHR